MLGLVNKLQKSHLWSTLSIKFILPPHPNFTGLILLNHYYLLLDPLLPDYQVRPPHLAILLPVILALAVGSLIFLQFNLVRCLFIRVIINRGFLIVNLILLLPLPLLPVLLAPFLILLPPSHTFSKYYLLLSLLRISSSVFFSPVSLFSHFSHLVINHHSIVKHFWRPLFILLLFVLCLW